MGLRVGILVSVAVLGLGLLGVWIFMPSTLIEMRHLLDREALEALVALAISTR